jgi:dolichyl-phosphate-mannose--protein O-mannosyl transferase
MNGIPWILIAILIAAILLGFVLVVFVRKRKQPRRVDYRNYFVMGVIWLAAAPVLTLLPWLLHGEEPFFMASFFLIMGSAYTIIGLLNRDKWGKQLEVSPATEKKMMIVIGALVISLLAGIVVFLFAEELLFLR